MLKLFLLTLLVVQLFAFSLFDSKPQGQCNKVEYLVSVKDLVVATQKTRGLTNSYLNGNIVAQLLVYNQRKEMKKAFKRLRALSEKSKNLIDKDTQERIDALEYKIKKLNKVAFKIDAQTMFDAYTNIINETLQITSDMVKRNCKDCEPLAKDAVSSMVNTLLPLTENIGKLRGLGAGMAAHGSATAEQSKKMRAFIVEIERLSMRMDLESSQLLRQHAQSYPKNMNQSVKQLLKEIKAYITLAQNSIVDKKSITIDANNYFDKGTAVIEDVLQLYSINREAIRHDN